MTTDCCPPVTRKTYHLAMAVARIGVRAFDPTGIRAYKALDEPRATTWRKNLESQLWVAFRSGTGSSSFWSC
ncbi:hypothetical protein NOVOSPHI9U_420082 [Novosphingobium sp. 9U]|nr:hypothetical protein NOVOSPHI9U_420082 [Novosphingobium sp. 9U]